jgi:alkyldihydroxyacetonephosphate synthase
MGRMDVDEYVTFQNGIIDAMLKHGGTLSHHHGVGRLMAPWMEAHLGKEQVEVLRAVKRHFDPNGIMNPGGQLGLDDIPVRRADVKGTDASEQD